MYYDYVLAAECAVLPRISISVILVSLNRTMGNYCDLCIWHIRVWCAFELELKHHGHNTTVEQQNLCNAKKKGSVYLLPVQFKRSCHTCDLTTEITLFFCPSEFVWFRILYHMNLLVTPNHRFVYRKWISVIQDLRSHRFNKNSKQITMDKRICVIQDLRPHKFTKNKYN
jgi:hypothetical protein